MGATDFFSHDLALIPWSQIPLTFQTKPTPKPERVEEDNDDCSGGDRDNNKQSLQSTHISPKSPVTKYNNPFSTAASVLIQQCKEEMSPS